jgi:hypothetical protein
VGHVACCVVEACLPSPADRPRLGPNFHMRSSTNRLMARRDPPPFRPASRRGLAQGGAACPDAAIQAFARVRQRNVEESHRRSCRWAGTGSGRRAGWPLDQPIAECGQNDRKGESALWISILIINGVLATGGVTAGPLTASVRIDAAACRPCIRSACRCAASRTSAASCARCGATTGSSRCSTASTPCPAPACSTAATTTAALC